MVSSLVLVQFAREPLIGRVKTRLFEALSQQQAMELHWCMLEHTCDILCTAELGEVQLWVDGDPQAAIFHSWRQRGVAEVQLTRSGLGWILVSDGIEAIEMVGFEGDLPVQFAGASDTGAGLYVPESLAREWSLEVGDVIEIASGYPTLTPLGPQPRVRRLPLPWVPSGRAGPSPYLRMRR